MRRRFFGQRDLLERESAAMLAESWGYPRAIDDQETQLGVWFTWGEAAVFWFALDSACRPGEVTFHLAMAPEDRAGRTIGRALVEGVLFAADLLEVERLRCDMGTPASREACYLRRLGWTESEPGVFIRELGG